MRSRPSSRGRRHAVVLAIVVGLVFAALAALPAGAAYPGPNGLISLRADVGDHSQLFTIDPVSLTLVQLTHLTDADVASAAHWSPDMGMLTFEVDPANGCAQVATLPATGGDPTLLPLANRDVCEATPTFSADGTRIIYEGFNGKHRDALFSMNLDGSGRRFVTACRGRGVTSPEASPDGKMLAFTCTSRDARLCLSPARQAAGSGS